MRRHKRSFREQAAWAQTRFPQESPVFVVAAAWMIRASGQEVNVQAIHDRLRATGRSAENFEEAA